jgi:spermidine/putrescine transport system substrate-binding protein
MVCRNNSSGIHRRDVLKLAAGTIATAGLVRPVAAQAVTMDVMLPNAVVSGKCREILEKEVGGKIVDAPFQSTPDSISRLLGPGGTSRFNVSFGIVDFARLPVLGPAPGAEKVSALDLSKIPNFSRLADPFKSSLIERGGKVYGIPVLMGYNTVLYNFDKVDGKDPLTLSWGSLFEDKYAGKIGWFESAHQMMFAAALYLGHEKPSSMTDAEVREVGDFMIKKKKNVRVIWTSFSQCANLFATGEIVVAYGTLPVRIQLEQQGVHVTNAWVKEGVVSLIGDVFIPKDSSNQDKSHALINAMLSDGYAAELPKVSGYLSSNGSGGDGMTAEQKIQAGYGIYSGETKNHPMPIPANLNTWVEVWSRVKSA